MKIPDIRFSRWHNTSQSYGRPSIAVHWLVAVLMAGIYLLPQIVEGYPKDSSTRGAIMAWHYALGLSVLWLLVVRVALRLMGERPVVVPNPPRWQRTLSRAVHAGLYLLMILSPVLGWLMLNADGQRLDYFGLELPSLHPENKDRADLFEELHETIGNAGYFLIAAHTLAALYHHYIKRDNALALMLPRK